MEGKRGFKVVEYGLMLRNVQMDASQEMLPEGKRNDVVFLSEDNCLPLQMVDFVCVLSLLSIFLVWFIF